MKKQSEIKTFDGETIIVDAADLAKVQRYTWCRKAKDRGAVAVVDGVIVDMHRFILGLERGESTSAVVKHINGNRLDNRRVNLLLTTSGVTIATGKYKQRLAKSVSGFKGVSPITQHGKTRWRARASIDKKEISLGHFDTPEAAAKSYDDAITKVYGALAVTNKSLGLLE